MFTLSPSPSLSFFICHLMLLHTTQSSIVTPLDTLTTHTCQPHNDRFNSNSIRFGGAQEMDMINLFGSPAGRAINEITSIKLNRSEQEAARLNQSKHHATGDRSKTASIRNDFIQLNLTKFQQASTAATTVPSATTPGRRDKQQHATATTNSNLLAKKIKFWKYFEENNNDNDGQQRRSTSSGSGKEAKK